jgi:hypothetical protein
MSNIWLHGLSNTRIYNIWRFMKRRCDKPNDKDYKYYGGKGISYCKEWETFAGFYEWVKVSGYKEDLTLERIDSDKDYSPDNCIWANMKQQNNNVSRNINITYEGKTKTMKQWSEELGLTYGKVKTRYKRGLPLDIVFYNGDLPHNIKTILSSK